MNTPTLQPLTANEKRVMEFLELYIFENGISPSYQEIQAHFGFKSIYSVQRYLKQLEEKGYLHIPGGNRKRAIQVLHSASAVQTRLDQIQQSASPSPEALNIPLLGTVAAGRPLERTAHDEFVDIPASMVRYADRTYALQVEGQSMIEDGIFEGDLLLVQQQDRAHNGDIVVAVVDNEATVKRFYLHERSGASGNGAYNVELRPANQKMASLWYRPDDVEIRGIVVGLIRKF